MTSATVAGSAAPVVKGLGRSHSNYSPGNVQPLNLPITYPLSPILSLGPTTSLAFTLSILLIASGVGFLALALAFSPFVLHFLKPKAH